MHLPALVLSFSLLGTALGDPDPDQDQSRPLEDRAAAASNLSVVISTGTVVGSVSNKIETFGGIPFAEPPTGQLRLKPPVRLTRNLGTFDATGPVAACPQMLATPGSENLLVSLLGTLANLPLVQNVTNQSEDCLTINVSRPEGTTAESKLPVLFWIFGGGFQLGSTSMYDGSSLVQFSVDAGKPYIFVAVNYRVAGFGFMPGKEILEDGSANLGLLDQRMGLEWVADNIAAFGGDPEKVTIWGESAGSISVLDQMILYGGNNQYKGKPLFRGAIMDSGSIVPADPVDCPKGQAVYDAVVSKAGCSSASDTLNCLRELPYQTFLSAVTSVPGILSYNSLALSYLPRPDGTAIPSSPDVMVENGQYAAVPMIIGDQEDEGTLFSLFQANDTTPADLVTYLKSFYFASASTAELDTLVGFYGTGAAAVTGGSPFRTGLANEVTPGFKRRAAVLGDLVFTLTRRVFLTAANAAKPGVPSWSYLASYDYGTPVLGTFHATDIAQVFYGIKDNYAARSIRTYYTNFVSSLDPNAGSSGQYPNWPRWSQGQNLVQFFAGSSSLLKDDFRKNSSDWIMENVDILHI